MRQQIRRLGERAGLTSTGIFSLGLMVGCASGPEGPGETTGDSSGATTSGVTTSGATTTAGTTDTGGDTTGPDGEVSDEELYPCEPGIPVTTQVGRLLNREYDRAVETLLGVTTLTGMANQRPSDLLPADSKGAMDPYRWTALQTVADAISKQVIAGPEKAKFMDCDPATTATCYADTVANFGRKAFRRPLTAEEQARFLGLTTIEPAGTPDEIAQILLYAFLVSPSFIMAPEFGSTPAEPTEGVPADAIKLTDHEIALRLSRMLWGDLPDEILAKAADDGQLHTSEQIAAQAARMIAVRDKAGARVALAHRDYLDMDDSSTHWWSGNHDPAIFTTYDEAAKGSMSEEYNLLFEEIVFNDGTFKDLFLTTKGYVNADTAPMYGLDPTMFGPELTPYEFDPSQRPGVLTRVGFLDSYSGYDATSPIQRGAFLATKIIGVKVGAPDPNALLTPIPPGTYATRRDQIDALTSDATCAKCHHEAVNPPGYILENFNAIGVWQTKDRLGGDIDPSAMVGFGEDDLRSLNGVAELMNAIAENPNSKKIYAQKIVASSMGRSPNNADACVRDEIVAKMDAADEGYPILNIFSDITQADSFRLRVRGE